jgi:hypothetical protein
MRKMREQIDLMVYVRAFGVLARNPTVVVVPLVAAVAGVLVGQITSVSGGGLASGFTAGISQFIVQLLELFGLGVAIIIGDAGWRFGRISFDDAWQDARRKAGDIFFAAFGFTFVLNIAQYAQTIIGAVGLVLVALAVYGLIYTIAAAAIGGVPGSGAIGVSVERVRSAPLTAGILTAITILLLFFLSPILATEIDAAVIGIGVEQPIIAALIDAVVQSIVVGYLGIVMAKVYSSVSFTGPRW